MSQKKQIFKLSILRKFLDDVNSCVSLVPSTRLLGLPPFFLNDMKSGIFYLLNNILKKYDRSLDGIIMGYQNVKILMDENTGIIPIGSAETEVNVSAEFYIFQPKIGNTLEGVINKKSNNHIGCLVHKYFNATILKPEDVNFEDWNCKDLDVNDKILFKVKDLDFTGLLPYIEGIICDEELLGCAKSKEMGGCDLNDLKEFQSKILSEGMSGIKKKKKKEKKEKEDSVSEFPKEKEEGHIFPEFILQNFLHTDSDSDFVKPVNSKKEKKTNKNKEPYSSCNKICEGLPQKDELFYSTQLEPHSESKMNTSCSPIPKRISDVCNDKLKTPQMIKKTERKDRKRKSEDPSDASEAKKVKKNQNPANGSTNFVSELLPELNKVSRTLNLSEKSNDEMDAKNSDLLYEKLMKEVKNEIAFQKKKETDSNSTGIRSKKKKKHKEHKSEKFKNGSMYDIEISPEKKTPDKNEKFKNGSMYDVEITPEKKTPDKNEKLKNGSMYDVEITPEKITPDKNEKFKNGSMYDVEITPEKIKSHKNLFSDSETNHQSLDEKKNVNGVASTKKSLIQTMLDQFFREEGKKLKNDSDRESLKESTSKGKKESKPKNLKSKASKESEESLFEKLLREAKSRFEIEDSPPKKKRKRNKN